MFILNDVNLSNYGRGRDRTKRKSRGNLLRNAAIGVGGLAVAGGLGYLALKGKGKSVTKSATKPIISINQQPHYSQLTKEELKKLTSKQRLELRKKAIFDAELKNEGLDPNNKSDLFNNGQGYNPFNRIKHDLKQINNKTSIDYRRKTLKEESQRIKQWAGWLRQNGAYYSSYSSLNNF